MWLNPTSANGTGVAIGGIVKETKPGKILIEDDEGKVGVPGEPSQPHSCALPSRALSPSPSLVLLPNTRGDPCGRTDHSGVLSW